MWRWLVSARLAVRALILLLMAACFFTFPGNRLSFSVQDVVIRTTTSFVLVDVVAFDKKTGARLDQLSREDVELLDNNRRVAIGSFDRAARPIALWFVMICNEQDWYYTGSTFFAGKSKLLRPVLGRLNERDTVGVAHWCDDGMSSIDLAPSLDREAALATIEEVLHRAPSVEPDCAPGTLALQETLRRIHEITLELTPLQPRSEAGYTPVIVFIHGDSMGMSVSRARTITESMLEMSAMVYGIGNTQYLGSRSGIRCKSVIDSGEASQMELAHYWASETGGRFVRIAGDEQSAQALDAIVGETHTRYQLGFSPQMLDGRLHQLRVRLSPAARERYKNAALRYRSGYKAAAEGKSKTAAAFGHQPIRNAMPFSLALTATKPFTDFRMEAAIKGLAGPAAQFVVAASGPALSWTLLENEDRRAVLTIVTGYLSEKGELLDYHIRDFRVTRARDKWESAKTNPVVLPLTAQVPPGASAIRVIVRDADSGRTASTNLPLSKPAAPLR